MSVKETKTYFKPVKAVALAILATFAWPIVWLLVEQTNPNLLSLLGGYFGVLIMTVFGGIVWGVFVIGIGLDRVYTRAEEAAKKAALKKEGG